METVPKTMDWVAARAECSIGHLFALLTEVIESDVKSMQARTPSAKITLNKLTDSEIVVAVERNRGGFIESDSVLFDRTEVGITAKASRGDKLLFTANPSLSFDGSCRLEVDKKPLELWQVSQKALEELFFGSSRFQ